MADGKTPYQKARSAMAGDATARRIAAAERAAAKPSPAKPKVRRNEPSRAYKLPKASPDAVQARQKAIEAARKADERAIAEMMAKKGKK